MSTSALTLIQRAAAKIGVKITGQNLSTTQQTDGLSALNELLGSLANENLLAFDKKEEHVTLSIGTESYTIGEDGTPSIDTPRPEVIIDAFVRDASGNDYPVEIISLEEYHEIPIKTTSGRPYLLAYNTEYPNITVYLYYTPDAAETLYITSLKGIVAFDETTATADLSPGYERMLILNLARELAPEFGKALDQNLADLAEKSKEALKIRNAKTQIKPVKLDVAELSNHNSGNINTGWE